MPTITMLIIEDEPDIAELMRFHLHREGFAVRSVHSGRVALNEIERNPPDLILLDLMLPDLDGLEVCRRLKRVPQTADIPIVMVTAKGEEADIVTGIELGADDYITKPFSPRVLVTRVKNVLRRRGDKGQAVQPQQPDSPASITLAGGTLQIDPGRHVVSAYGSAVELTLTEFGILHYLAKHPGFVRTRDQIIAAVHGRETVLSSRTIDVHVTALRRKLGDLGELIQTVRGVGYRIKESAGELEE
jgi:two-component system, OmpR family, alkaline phosphatase synthesis response regulator PhoP